MRICLILCSFMLLTKPTYASGIEVLPIKERCAYVYYPDSGLVNVNISFPLAGSLYTKEAVVAGTCVYLKAALINSTTPDLQRDCNVIFYYDHNCLAIKLSSLPSAFLDVATNLNMVFQNLRQRMFVSNWDIIKDALEEPLAAGLATSSPYIHFHGNQDPRLMDHDLTMEDIYNHLNLLTKNNALIGISGDIDAKHALKGVNLLLDGLVDSDPAPPSAELLYLTVPDTTKLHYAKHDKEYAFVHFSIPDVSPADENYAINLLVASVLGDRLLHRTRGLEGLVYSSMQFQTDSLLQDSMLISTTYCQEADVEKIIACFNAEVTRVITEGISIDELEKKKQETNDRSVMEYFGTPELAAASLMHLLYYKLPLDDFTKCSARISALSLERANEIAVQLFSRPFLKQIFTKTGTPA